MTASKSGVRGVLCLLLAALLMLMVFPMPTASALGLNTTSTTITKGYAVQLKLTGADKATWSSSDKTVATVSSTGKVTGKSIGTAVITANVNGTKLTCKVKVVGGKITLSSKSVTMNPGDVKYITVRAKGNHGVKAVPDNKSIVSTAWVKPWNNDDIRLKLTAKAAGTTSIRVSMTKYPEVYAVINVKVNGNDPVIQVSQSFINTRVNENASFVIYSDPDNSVNYSLSDTTVAKVTEGTWKDHYCTITVTGLKAGTANLTLTRKDNPLVSKTVSINVSGAASEYYKVSDTSPARIVSSDLIYNFKNSAGTIKYMLLPYNYDPAKANSAVAAYLNSYEYYIVYESMPNKRTSTDDIKSFTATIGSQNVTRYILLPTNPDIPTYNTAVADYTGKVEYWTVYNKSPENKKLMSTDVVKSWTTTLNYKLVTRYILLPMNYDEGKLNAIIQSDAGSVLGGYYAVSAEKPALKASTDKIITFTSSADGTAKTYYILVPQNYDNGKVNDAIAAFNGFYEYWTIYNTMPVKRLSSDIIESWTKVIDGKQVTRYVLLGPGYSQTALDELKAKDLGTSSSAYYTVTTTRPVNIAATDIVWVWYNAKEGVTKYMLLPEKFNVLKRNDLVYQDTGVFEYYTIYSAKPTLKESSDIILPTQYTGGTVYMLVPKDYDNAKVNQGLAGLLVTV